MNTPPIGQPQKKSDLINKIKTATSSLSMQKSLCEKDCMKVLHIIETELIDKVNTIDFYDYKVFKKKCDKIFDGITDNFPNLNLDYDEQLIEITNQDIQFAFEKFVNRKDRNSLTDLIQVINQNTK